MNRSRDPYAEPLSSADVLHRLQNASAAPENSPHNDGNTLKVREQDIHAATEEYLSLSKQYENSKLPWKERNQIAERLNSLADEHLHAKAFNTAVQNSMNAEAIKRLEVARHVYEVNRDRDKGRGLEM
jgi:hypothetical protein